ncbi:TRC40/GET3/ArsA family transport-energizing ATPase [Halopenitus sp. POP-27]|uniref:ArsA family ATPase n=1 Tax=Halopenitus sp. POP-27 TaxID=2994425 RepID=UPI0024685C7A|nr:TRC40/GET3/ArsA family transport-energizing ATPase [Halopenitus sp. POP-27]
MDEIDVEPVDSVDAGSRTDVDADLPAGIDAPEYVLYGGKGGVGKTTMAAATGLSSAAGGVDTLVVSTDPAHSLSDTYGVDVPATPARIREDIPLYAAEIDPDDAMEEGLFGTDGDPLGGLGDLGEMAGGAGGDHDGLDDPADGPAGGLLDGTMPGADEAAAMRQLLEYLDDPRFDRVIVDTAPTGHTLRLLELPELMDSMIGRVMKLRQQFSGMMDGLTGLFGGDGDDPDPSEDLDALRERIERLRDVLRDPDRTDFRIVMIPEEMSVVESERLRDQLGAFGIPVETIVVNRVMEDLANVADVDPEWVVAPNLEDCAFCQRRWQVQQNALERASDLFRGREVKRVPLLGDAVRGDAALRVVAACLE